MTRPSLLNATLLVGVLSLGAVGCDNENETGDTQPEGIDEDADGWTAGEDCDDEDPSVHPGADEHCDGIDEDCDGRRDEDAVDAVVRYPDADGDGYGDPDRGLLACEHSAAYLEDDTDCDDFDWDVHPSAVEVCNGVDDDCDGSVDDADDSLDLSTTSTYYADTDGDDYGDEDVPVRACEQPDGGVVDDTDCDDGDDQVHPEAEEVPWDGVDQDCDDADLCDADGDGFDADREHGVGGCGGEDCDDSEPAANPGVDEFCDGVDNDCDGLADEADACNCEAAYYREKSKPYLFCSESADWSTALLVCEAFGYHLATVGDAAEQTWLHEQAAETAAGTWWIGYTDAPEEGDWFWQDGSTSIYTRWCGPEPSNGHGGECLPGVTEEDCALLNALSSGCWNDYPCACPTPHFICEAM